MAYGSGLMDVVQSSTAGTPPQFNDGNGTQVGTLCRAWVNFNGASGASPVIRASFNVSSVVRNSTGNYTISFTNALSDANYSITASVNRSGSFSWFASIGTLTSSSVPIIVTDTSASFQDANAVLVSVFR